MKRHHTPTDRQMTMTLHLTEVTTKTSYHDKKRKNRKRSKVNICVVNIC